VLKLRDDMGAVSRGFGIVVLSLETAGYRSEWERSERWSIVEMG